MKSEHRNLFQIISTALAVLLLAVGCSDKPQSSPRASLSAAPEESMRTTTPRKITLASAFRLIPMLYVATSYDPDRFAWTRDVIGGIVQGLADGGLIQGVDYQMVSQTMATLTNITPEQMQTKANRILADIRARRPDLVLATDDDALKWVGLKLDDVPVVFNGVNGNRTGWWFEMPRSFGGTALQRHPYPGGRGQFHQSESGVKHS